jgi:hypothetical protein
MSHRWIAPVGTAVALLVAGCGADRGPSPTSATTWTSGTAPATSPDSTSAGPNSTTAAPQQTLSQSACTDLTGASLELSIATTTADGQRAAAIFAKYHPPPDVRQAVDHFVSARGAHSDDPDFDESNRRIDDWVAAVCPQ